MTTKRTNARMVYVNFSSEANLTVAVQAAVTVDGRKQFDGCEDVVVPDENDDTNVNSEAGESNHELYVAVAQLTGDDD